MAVDAEQLEQELHGLDTLETPQAPARPLGATLWSAAWPKLAAVAQAMGRTLSVPGALAAIAD